MLSTLPPSTPWAIAPPALASLRARISSGSGPRSYGRAYTRVGHTGHVALIQVLGVLLQRVGPVEQMLGIFQSVEDIGRDLEAAASDPYVRTILLEVDSDGGSVFGVTELAAKIRQVRERKRVFAVANSVAAGAPYWLASQASEFTVTPSGLVGGVGILAVHEDWTAAEAKQGITTTIIKAGAYKADGDPSQPLTDDARRHLQAIVDAQYGLFVEDVAKGRGTTPGKVRSDFGQGRVVTSTMALRAGMVDRVATLPETLASAGMNAPTIQAIMQRLFREPDSLN